MPGDLDPRYVRARKVLLDALDALGGQRRAVVLVGAQAVYVRVGEAGFAVSPYTEDADLALSPALLLDAPALAEAMGRGRFESEQPGIWKNADGVTVDLLVPEALGGPGRRGARLGPPHGNKVARKVKGLEAALVDNTQEIICALDEADARQIEIAVAGSAALLVAKLHKIAERAAAGRSDRLDDKDALDVFRLLRGTDTGEIAAQLARLTQDSLAGAVTLESLGQLRDLFGTRDTLGTQMVVQGTAGVEDPTTTAASCEALATDLLVAIKSGIEED
jgi:hypothetical protein